MKRLPAKPSFMRCVMMFFILGTTLSTLPADEPDSNMARQYYEVRTYVIGETGDEAAIDDYLQNALLPALDRNGQASVGVFEPASNDENDLNAVFVVIPHDSADAIAIQHQRLESDEKYLADAKDYLELGPKNAPYERISSELLVAMACMPAFKVPEGTIENADRVYELRLYESANERLGALKVDMFNNGEVPIFLDSGITPIFIGRAVIGPQTPSLTYLTVYPNEQARLKAWRNFRSHPDWQVLKAVEKYQGTVSKIDKYILKPKAYSRM